MFLDTARLGRMTPSAQRAQIDFARFAGEEGASPALEQFLVNGFGNVAYREEYPGLASWSGIAGLKTQLRQLANSKTELPVLIASRSAVLMRLAARLLCHPCRNILTVDFSWPGYREILDQEAKRANRRITTVQLQGDVLAGRVEADHAVERIRDEYLANDCDGLFLPAVNNLGIRLPVRRIVQGIESVREPRFVVIDGAQEFCHAPSGLSTEHCDFYLAGCHKWLGAYHPMGVGFYGRRQSTPIVETLVAHLTQTGELDDPLLRFSNQLEASDTRKVEETVNLAALFTCQGAITDALSFKQTLEERLKTQLANRKAFAEIAESSGWETLPVREGLSSGILLLEPKRAKTRERSARETRTAFATQNVILSAYESGRVRLSIPQERWQTEKMKKLLTAE